MDKNKNVHVGLLMELELILTELLPFKLSHFLQLFSSPEPKAPEELIV